MKRYVRYFEDDLDEACPEGSKERNGQWEKKDNSGYLRNVCPIGNIWDGKVNKCIPHTK